MVCGPIEGDPADPLGWTITNPTLIVEILSTATEEDSGAWEYSEVTGGTLELSVGGATIDLARLYADLPV